MSGTPRNLRIEQHPYPHLRDDDGCVLARDYIHDEKMAFVLEAVREKLEREQGDNTAAANSVANRGNSQAGSKPRV